MKKIFIVLAVMAGVLSGCVGYVDPYGNETGYRNRAVHRSDDGSRRNDRDRDHDGIPNRIDRDRDGDGVPNRDDSRPNNPNRY